MQGSLLLISQHAEDLAFATEVAKTTNLRLIATQDSAAGAKAIATEELSGIILDASTEALYRTFEARVQESVGLFSDRINPNLIHFISSDTIDAVPYLTSSPLFGHLILRRYHSVIESGQHYGRILMATSKERAFGLGTLMKPGTKIQTLKLVSSEQKQNAVEAVKNYMIAAKFQSRIAALIANAIDEILMNAIFNAPADNLGKPLYANTSRATALKLEGKSSVEMQIGFDGSYIGITAIDHFGSLDKARLLAHVARSYTDEEYKVKISQAGAGIGLATVCRTGGSFFFSSESRERTESTVFFRKTDSYREFKDQFRFFSTQFYF